MALVGYLLFLAMFSIAISSPVAIAAIGMGWLASLLAQGERASTVGRASSVASLWIMARSSHPSSLTEQGKSFG